MKIYNDNPIDWKDLQCKVAQVFNDMGCNSSIEKTIQTVRGKVSIDVFVLDKTTSPNLIYICECKNWNTKVPKTVIHSFRTVVADSGSHCGYIISKNGFQSGAYKVVENSNIFIMDWTEFLRTFEDRWLFSMISKVHEYGKPLRDYCNPMSSFFVDRLMQLKNEEREQFEKLVEKYLSISTYTFKDWYLEIGTGKFVKSEFIDAISSSIDKIFSSSSINSYNDYFSKMIEICSTGIKEIDLILGEPMRK
jgi:hypothetical protein